MTCVKNDIETPASHLGNLPFIEDRPCSTFSCLYFRLIMSFCNVLSTVLEYFSLCNILFIIALLMLDSCICCFNALTGNRVPSFVSHVL